MFNKRYDIVPYTKRFNYKINNFKGVDAESDENSIGLDYCSYGYNISFVNGTLMNGIGICSPYIITENGKKDPLPNLAEFGRGICKLFLYRRKKEDGAIDDRLVALLDNYKFYMCAIHDKVPKFFEILDMTSQTEKVSFANYHLDGEDVLLVNLDSGGMYVYDGQNALFYQDAPAINSTCIHYERLYGSKGNTLHFSKVLAPTDWEIGNTGAGYINFMDEGGKIIKVVSFKDYVFIFRERAIHRLTAYTEPGEYKLTKVFSTSSMICENTIVVAGDNIVFMADNYLYSFDGYSTKRIFSKVTALIAGQTYSTATFFKNKYYLTAMLKTKDEIVGDEVDGIFKNNGMLIFDFYSGEVSIFRGTDIGEMLPLVTGNTSSLLLSFNNKRQVYLGMVDDSGRLMDIPLNKKWVSPKNNLGSLDSYKILRRIRVSSLHGVKIGVELGEDNNKRNVNGNSKPTLLTYRNVGDDIRLQIETDNDKLYVSSVMMDLDLSRRYYAD